jgi:hypothetical protein
MGPYKVLTAMVVTLVHPVIVNEFLEYINRDSHEFRTIIERKTKGG